MARVYTKQELIRLGLTEKDVRNALRCCLRRVRRGFFAPVRPCDSPAHASLHPHTPTQPADYPHTYGDIRDHSEKLKLLIRSRLPDLQPTDAFSHISAALLHGIQPPYPATEQVEFTRIGYHANFPELRIYDRALTRSDRVRVGEFLVTDLARTLADLAHDYPLEISVPMISEALHWRRVGRSELDDHLSSRRRGSRTARSAFDLADSRHESQGESLCAVKFHRLGIRGMVPQVDVYDRAGSFIGRADFRHEDLPLIAEFHGLGKYYLNADGPDRASKDNHKRHMKLTNAGYTVFNLVWADLFRDELFVAIKQRIAESGPQHRERGS